MIRSEIVGTLLFILFGPIVWALHLGISYAAHAALCAAGDRLPLAQSDLPWLLGATTIGSLLFIALAVLAPAVIRRTLGAVRDEEEAWFATALMRGLGLLSLAGVVYFGLSMMIVPLCLPLR
jgi:hypothetical protein